MFEFPGGAIRVLLADDADVLRTAIRRLLQECPEIELIAEVSNLEHAMRIARDIKPDVILLDLHMLTDTPTELAEILPLENSRLLAMSFDNSPEMRVLAENLGAVAVLDKMYLGDELIPAILNTAPAKARHATAT